MKIEISYTRKTLYSKVVEIEDLEIAERLLSLNGCNGDVRKGGGLMELTEWCGEGDEFLEDDYIEGIQVSALT